MARQSLKVNQTHTIEPKRLIVLAQKNAVGGEFAALAHS
jgi:hypothetical protein